VTLLSGVFCFEWWSYNFLLVPRVLLSGKGHGAPSTCFSSWALVCGFNVSWALALWSYLRCAFTDPGRVPEAWHSEFDGFAASSAGTCSPAAVLRAWQPGLASFCRGCEEQRPERAHHCRTCGACILRMDHHCPWVGNCVGINNHKFFILMCFYTSVAGTFYAASALPMVVKIMAGRQSSLDPNDPVVLMLIVASTFASSLGLSTAGLFFTHVRLAWCNRTTIEAGYKGKSPYSLGPKRNFEQVFGVLSATWLLPVPPLRKVTDGLRFPTSLSPGDAV